MESGEKWSQGILSLFHAGEGFHQLDYAADHHESWGFVVDWVTYEEFFEIFFDLGKLVITWIVCFLFIN